MSLFFGIAIAYFLYKIKNWRIDMTIALMPLKFECSACQHQYYQHYKDSELHYPNCPHCHKNGLLMGIAEPDDLLKHPYDLVCSIFKSLNKPSKQHL